MESIESNVTTALRRKKLFRRSEIPKQHNRMVIEWSNEDQVYVVKLPDFPGGTPFTHGQSYREAAKAGEEVLELLLS